MENLKIRVNSEAESKEVQDFAKIDGYSRKYNSFTLHKGWVCLNSEKDILCVCHSQAGNELDDYKEITLPELRDLVVLKRNNRNDRTHTDQDNWSWFISSNGTGYVFGAGNANGLHQWDESSLDMVDLKPIEKPIEKKEMKEYLRKNSNNTYSYIGTVRPEHVSDFMIEIPEGRNIAVIEDSKVKFYSKYTSADLDHLGKDLIWMRPSHPEELPFIDDEPKEYLREDANGSYILELTCKQEATEPHAKHWIEVPVGVNFYYSFASGDKVFTKEHSSLGRLLWQRKPPFSINDQYAEIEKVRQSAWQKQEGGSHYKNLKIQPMQYALENKLDYAQANVVKYVTRHKEKNGKEDLLKAIHNIELMIEFYYGGGE